MDTKSALSIRLEMHALARISRSTSARIGVKNLTGPAHLLLLANVTIVQVQILT